MIGAPLVARLVNEQGYDVVAVDSRVPQPEASEAVRNYVVDVATSEIDSVLAQERPTTIFHLAARPGGRSISEPLQNVLVNSLGSMRLIDWSARNGARFIFASSSVIYEGNGNALLSEESRCDPRTIYGVNKLACEGWLDILGHSFGLQWVALRLFSTYGLGHLPSSDQGIVNVMLTQMLRGPDVEVRGSLERVRDLVYVDDVVEALIRVAKLSKLPNRPVNVCTGQPTTIGEILAIIAESLGLEFSQFNVKVLDGTPGDPFYNVGLNQRLRSLIGYTPSTAPCLGIKKYVSQVILRR